MEASLKKLLCVLVAAAAVGVAFFSESKFTSPFSLPAIEAATFNTSLWGLFWGTEADDCSCTSLAATDSEEVGSCKVKGTVSDCCCDYATINRLNQHHLHPLISDLVKLPFFRYFKVNLFCDCHLWPDDGMCSLQACSVCECEESEVPEVWKIKEKIQPIPTCDEDVGHGEFVVNRSLEPGIKKQLLDLPGWRGFNNPWMSEDTDEREYSYINLLVNPERYTGYKGADAQRVWTAIYSQACLSEDSNPGEEECEEKRIFYRLISGLHSSITAHIAKQYLVDEEKDVWGPNLELFESKLGRPELKSRVENLYFAFSFVLRAVMRGMPLIEKIEFDTGSPEEDAQTANLVGKLVNHPSLQNACPVPFDEGRLWKGDRGIEMKAQLQLSFQNITRIMDCVGCEKCKLWGKLQTLGLATALKILFHDDNCDSSDPQKQPSTLVLERNELIALINLLERLSQSIETYRVLSIMLDEQISTGTKSYSGPHKTNYWMTEQA